MRNSEAKNYLCPQSFTATASPCRGMKCAAWRWAEPKWGDVEQRRGYCGLAGEAKFPLNPEHEK